MIKSAIGEDVNKPEDTAGNLGRGKDIQTIVKGLEPDPEPRKGEEEHSRPSVTNLKKMLRKKHRKLNSLEFDSEEEDISDEDFKGSSNESEEEEDEEGSEGTDDSEDYMGRKRRKNLPTRRSTRARTRRYDADFIDDDSDEEPPKRKKKKSIWDETDSEDSETSVYGRKEKRKKKKKKQKNNSDDEPTVKKTRPRIKYGGLTSSEEEELGKGRRTRGKKTTYVDTLGSDSEEEALTRKNPRRIDTDDDEDFVANEDEVEDDEKYSDDNREVAEAEAEDEVEDEVDSEQERREKRSLLVPKIYIKKPLGAKKQRELEAAKGKVPVSAEKDTTIKKSEEKASEEPRDLKGKESEPVKAEKELPIAEVSKSVESKPSVDVSKNPESVKPDGTTDHMWDNMPRCDESKIVENAIKREVDETYESIEVAKLKLANADLPSMNIHLEDAESKLPNSGFDSPVSLTKLPPKRGRKPKIVHEPIISNVPALFKNDDENDDLSEPPGISLPFFDDLSNSANSKEAPTPDTPKKRRGPAKKKTLEETLSSIGTRLVPTKVTQPAIEIAAPPQPFSQAQPTPSVITRMLQSKPGITIYPVGRIRPKQFATMRDDDSDESSPKNSPASSPAAPPIPVPSGQFSISGGPRGPPPNPYHPHGPHHPSMNHYPRGPPGYRPPPPQGMIPHLYSHHPSHRAMDPSPSGGGPINLTDPGPGPPSGNLMTGPGRESPGKRAIAITRYPPVGQTSPGPIMNAPRPPISIPPQQAYPPPTSSTGPPSSHQGYHPPPTSTPHQPFPPRPPASTNNPPPQQSYPPPNSNSAPPLSQQSYPPPPATNNGPPPQQSYQPRPSLSNGPPSQPSYPPTSNHGSTAQPPYPPRPASNSGSQRSYSPRPINSGPPSAQPPEAYYGSYPPPTTEESAPATSYQGVTPGEGSPYQEPYSGEEQPAVVPPSEGNSNKAYEEESGGEFAGLASYFSSQRDDDLES